MILTLVFLLLLNLAIATTLTGTIYNQDLEPEPNVLVQVSSQRYLSLDGTYMVQIPAGTYPITITKEDLTVTEEVVVQGQVTYYDLFLIPDFDDEDDLWKDTEEDLFEDEKSLFRWEYLVAIAIVIYALIRFFKARLKYGPLNKFRKRVKEDSKKTVEQHKAELEKEPGQIDKAVEIIKKHDGRITQKELRKEMLYLSEAKVSLILTELEHKGLVERVKKGRGNVVILKN